MMLCLLCLMVVLAVHSVLLEGGSEGLKFYLMPDFGKMVETGIGEAVFAALGQSFFTLSIGIGALAIFGSYIGKEQRLTGEAVNVTVLDTLVAFMAGLIIFPACSAYNIEPQAGPSLIFITLPNVFNHMVGGRLWGHAVFHVYVLCRVLHGDCGVPEHHFLCHGSHRLHHQKSGAGEHCADYHPVHPLRAGDLTCGAVLCRWGPESTVLDLEDFVLSNNLLPIGSMVYLVFCTSRYGWGL